MYQPSNTPSGLEKVVTVIDIWLLLKYYFCILPQQQMVNQKNIYILSSYFRLIFLLILGKVESTKKITYGTDHKYNSRSILNKAKLKKTTY